MVAYLQKSEGSEGFHQIVDFLVASHISTLDNGDMEITATIDGKVKVVFEAYIRRHLKLEDSDGIIDLPTIKKFDQLALMGQETKVPQPNSPTQTHVADEAASTGVDVRHGGAATTVSSLDARQGSGNIDKTLAMPHDSPLPRVHTLGSDEGRMQHNELMDLVTKLSDRVVSFETDLHQTKKVYGATYTKLIKKVKRLEDKLNKLRRKRRLVLSKEEDSDTEILAQEDPSKQGRKISQIDDDEGISLVQMGAQNQGRHDHEMESDFEFTTAKDVSTANVPVNAASAEISTASPKVKTVGVSVDDVATEDLVYIRRSAAKRKDKGKAIMEESEPTQTKIKVQQEQERLGFEEAQRLQEKFDEEERQRIACIHEEASTFKPEEWDNIQAQIEADEELTHKLQAQERERYSEADKAKLLYMGSHTLQQLRGYSFDKIKVIFEATMKRVNTFTLMKSDNRVPKVVTGSSKRSAKEELGEENSKRQKIAERSEPAKESKDKKSDELSQEQLQQLMIIVPEEGMNVEALQTKYQIIDWEVYTKDSRMYWKIIRVGNHAEVYQIFKDMLKNFDRDDLVELKRLFKPVDDDELWKS
ncbi:hypothetical protein Tco_0923168 [Tanacetum coccineum]|uniref:Uncharacterized protein n=1 Tax=Tanacetum coccineum TaxID=301880 RepID=A0ABQ5D169_9ASTR